MTLTRRHLLAGAAATAALAQPCPLRRRGGGDGAGFRSIDDR
jgi:hypothetical protein